jgi:hypothetical protein
MLHIFFKIHTHLLINDHIRTVFKNFLEYFVCLLLYILLTEESCCKIIQSGKGEFVASAYSVSGAISISSPPCQHPKLYINCKSFKKFYLYYNFSPPYRA